MGVDGCGSDLFILTFLRSLRVVEHLGPLHRSLPLWLRAVSIVAAPGTRPNSSATVDCCCLGVFVVILQTEDFIGENGLLKQLTKALLDVNQRHSKKIRRSLTSSRICTKFIHTISSSHFRTDLYPLVFWY